MLWQVAKCQIFTLLNRARQRAHTHAPLHLQLYIKRKLCLLCNISVLWHNGLLSATCPSRWNGWMATCSHGRDALSKLTCRCVEWTLKRQDNVPWLHHQLFHVSDILQHVPGTEALSDINKQPAHQNTHKPRSLFICCRCIYRYKYTDTVPSIHSFSLPAFETSSPASKPARGIHWLVPVFSEPRTTATRQCWKY